MKKVFVVSVVFLMFCSTAFAIVAVRGKVERVDSTAKTILVKAADGTEHTFHFVGCTAVHVGEKAGVVTKESARNLEITS